MLQHCVWIVARAGLKVFFAVAHTLVEDQATHRLLREAFCSTALAMLASPPTFAFITDRAWTRTTWALPKLHSYPQNTMCLISHANGTSTYEVRENKNRARRVDARTRFFSKTEQINTIVQVLRARRVRGKSGT